MSSDIPLIDRFNQPFDPHYGLTIDGDPTQDFIDFTHSNDIYVNIKINSYITKDSALLGRFLTFIGLTNPEVCLGSISLSSVNEEQLEDLIPKYPYLQNLYDYIKRSNIPYAWTSDYDPTSGRHLTNRFNIKDLKRCWNNHHNFIRISLVLYFTYKVPNPVHATQAIIDIETKKAYIIESALNFSRSLREQLELCKEVSLEAFLQKYIDPEITVESMDFNTCPAIHLQGLSDLCATWSLYLFLLILLNPHYTRTDIYNIFREYDQSERNLIILQFLYYLHSLELDNNLLPFKHNKSSITPDPGTYSRIPRL